MNAETSCTPFLYSPKVCIFQKSLYHHQNQEIDTHTILLTELRTLFKSQELSS